MDKAEQSNPKRSSAAPTTIDDLPIDLLIRILSFLPIFFAVRTSSVSQKWRNLWHFIPILEFYLERPLKLKPEHHLLLANRITNLLLNRPKSNPLREFRLSFHYFSDHRHRSLISSWIRYTIDCNAEEIELGFYCEDDDTIDVYPFHLSDLKNTPVRCLSLSDCVVVMPSNCLIRFDSIIVLSLTTVAISGESISSLISMCGSLEKFSLDLGILENPRNFKIRSKSLKVLRLIGYFGGVSEYCEESSLEIDAPNLSSIEISDFYVDSYIGDLASVDEAIVKFSPELNYSVKCWNNAMDLLRDVKSLNIQAPSARFMCSKFDSAGFELQRLKHLELKTGFTLGDIFGLSALFEKCPALETLVLNFVPETKEKKEKKEGTKNEGKKEAGEEEEAEDDEDEDEEEEEAEEEEDEEAEYDEDEEEDDEGDDEADEDEDEEKDEEEEEIDQEEVMRMLIKSSAFRFHIPSLQELMIQGCTFTCTEVLLVICLFMKSQTVLKKFVPVPAIPSPAKTRREGFVHCPF